MPTKRSVLLFRVEIPAQMNIPDDKIQDVRNWRKYCHTKGKTLPGDVEIQGMKDSKGNWHIEIFESPDTEHLQGIE